jgi:beta-galactosidase
MPERQKTWRDAAVERKVVGVSAVQDGNAASVTASTEGLPGGATQQIVYTIYGDGSIIVRSSFKAGSEKVIDMPRFGMQMQLPGEFREVTWFGRGPQENYQDRNLAAAVGLYKNDVDHMWFPYIEPQETGNRTDVRWATFTDKKGFGWKVSGQPTLYFSAWPFRMSELEHYKPPSTVGHRHPNEIVMAKDVTVNLDYKQMGVGGDDSWGALQHEEFRLPYQTYEYEFRLEPVAGNQKR